MNLVAKEFVASRTDGDGVLVLSEFAGASWELPEALQVNPYDTEGTAEVIFRALTMEPEERRARLAPLRERVATFDVHRWVSSFLEQLERVTDPAARALSPIAGEAALRDELDHVARARTTNCCSCSTTTARWCRSRRRPSWPGPTRRCVRLLRSLAGRPDTEVHIVSGRGREALEQWIGGLPIWLHAEHGFWSRPPGQARMDAGGRHPRLLAGAGARHPARHHRPHARTRSSR